MTDSGRDATQLVHNVYAGRISRADFFRRAAGLGLTVTGASGLLAAYGETAQAAVASAAKAPSRGGTAQIAMAGASTKDSMDPMLMADNPQQFTCGLLYDTLFNVDETTWKPLPGLVEHWEISSNARQYTLMLRDGVEFHNGKKLTSADVAYNLKRHTTKSYGSPMYARFENSLLPSGIQVVDAKTLKLHLINPDAYLPVALSLQWCGVVPAGFSKQGIGTGPFRVKTWTPGQGFEFLRNPGYWQNGKPYLDAVRAIDIEDPTAKVQSVTAGASDITDQIEYASLSTVQGSGSAKLLEGTNWAFQNIVMPAKSAPFNDPRVVQAVKLATDREKIVAVALAGHGTAVPDVCVPPGSIDMPTGLSLAPDIAGARKLLKEAGYPKGIAFTLHTSDAVSHILNIAIEFAQQVAPAGIHVTVQQVPAANYWDQNFLLQHPYLDWWSRLDVIDYVGSLYRRGAPFNETDFSNSQFETLMNRAQGTADATASASYLRQAMTLLSEKCSQIIPGFSNEYLAASKHLQGVVPSVRFIADFRSAYLT